MKLEINGNNEMIENSFTFGIRNIKLLIKNAFVFILLFSIVISSASLDAKRRKKKKKKSVEITKPKEELAADLDDDTNSIGASSGLKKLKGLQALEKFGSIEQKKEIWENIQWKMSFWTNGAQFNNADLRKLDESNDASIDLTDDKLSFAASGFSVGFYIPLTDDLAFNLSFYKAGLWGHDQLSGRDVNNNASTNRYGANPLNFGNELNVVLMPLNKSKMNLTMTIGRQPFSIGGIPTDFILDDVLDSIVVKYYFNLAGSLDILLFDYFWQGSDVTDVNYVQYLSGDNEKVKKFDGDTNTFRYGFVYTTSNFFAWGKKLDEKKAAKKMWSKAKLYSFMADYGAGNEGGSDRTYLGTTDNFADNDNVVLTGLRAMFNMDLLYFFADFAMSSGIDRKAKGFEGKNVDVDNNGKAITAGIIIKPLDFKLLRVMLPSLLKKFSTKIKADFFQADGGKYDKDGNQTSHGFVSFKGKQAGGLMMNSYYGIHPSAYTDDDGIDDWPHDRPRKSATQVIHAGLEVGFLEKYFIAADYWMFKDMNSTSIKDFVNRQDKAQKRLGKNLGNEINIKAIYNYNDFLKFHYTWGLFTPGAYYELVGLVDTAPQGNDKMWGMELGSSLKF